jgi:hypothetical protein
LPVEAAEPLIVSVSAPEGSLTLVLTLVSDVLPENGSSVPVDLDGGGDVAPIEGIGSGGGGPALFDAEEELRRRSLPPGPDEDDPDGFGFDVRPELPLSRTVPESGAWRKSDVVASEVVAGLLTEPQGLTEGLQGPPETFGQPVGLGQETGHNREGPQETFGPAEWLGRETSHNTAAAPDPGQHEAQPPGEVQDLLQAEGSDGQRERTIDALFRNSEWPEDEAILLSMLGALAVSGPLDSVSAANPEETVSENGETVSFRPTKAIT